MAAYINRLKMPHPVRPLDPEAWHSVLVLDFDRICLVCHAIVPYGTGVYVAHIRALAHLNDCAEAIQVRTRDHSKTTRGRWRRPSDVFKLSNGSRCADCHP